jgi:hypothetical protein
MNKQLNPTGRSEQVAETKQSGVDGNSVAMNSIVASAVQPGKLHIDFRLKRTKKKEIRLTGFLNPLIYKDYIIMSSR